MKIAIYSVIILIVLVNLSSVFIYKSLKKGNVNPTTRRTSRTSSRWMKFDQKVPATKNFITDKGSIYSGAFLRKVKCKKLKMKSQKWKSLFLVNDYENVQNLCFFGPVTSTLTFCNYLNNSPEYIEPSGHFVFQDFFCSSNFYVLFQRLWS